MEFPRIWLFAWPGLARLWGPGQWRGLASAVCFSVLLNAALLASWGGIGELNLVGRLSIWMGVCVFWVVSAWNSHRWWQQRLALPKSVDGQRLLTQAQEAYLRGHWVEAEGHLGELLAAREGDLEARLLLATLFRRTGRPDQAQEQLDDLARREGAERWAVEIRREEELLNQRP